MKGNLLVARTSRRRKPVPETAGEDVCPPMPI